MRISLKVAGGAALAAALFAAAIPAIGQDRPESLLPPGFSNPAPATPSTNKPAAPASAAPNVPASSAPAAPGQMVQSLPSSNAALSNTTAPAEAAPDPGAAMRFDIPDYARRSTALVGAMGPKSGGVSPDAFGNADGRYLETLMRHTNAPLASRWMSILLRRTLMSKVNTPSHVDGADFAAERAWLLLRMGEADGARVVVQAVDNDRYTPKMYQIAMQAWLANGDPGGMCGVVDAASRVSDERGWVLAKAMCAGLGGDPNTAGPAIDSARKRGVAGGIDLLLAEKVVGLGAEGRRAVTIQWDGVDRLDAWRYGLALATGVEVPEALYGTVGPQTLLWRATAPQIDAQKRGVVAEQAAAQGVLSNLALVDLFAEVDANGEQGTAEAGIARDLRQAYSGINAEERLAAIKKLWDEPTAARAKYARLVLTARACVRIPPEQGGDERGRLIASMLSAGLETAAMRWQSQVSRGSDGWAMLALANPHGGAPIAYGDVDAYRGSDSSADKIKTRMLVAGLVGLGRLSQADAAQLMEKLAISTAGENSWTRAIDKAARAKQVGTVVLLSAVGMQTRDWRGVPPENLFRIIAALRAVGREGEARMIAVEAISRL